MTHSRGNKRPRPGKRSSRGTKALEGEDEGKAALFPELFRRALALGFSGIFSTEEAFRRALGDTLPKDWVDFAVEQSERTRTEFVNRLAGEIARVLETLDLEALARKLIEEHRFEVKAEIRLVPGDEESQKGATGRGRSGTIKMADGGRRK